jgi:hypothetical protein
MRRLCYLEARHLAVHHDSRAVDILGEPETYTRKRDVLHQLAFMSGAEAELDIFLGAQERTISMPCQIVGLPRSQRC